MTNLTAKIRKEKVSEAGLIPAVLYGPGIENVSLEIDKKVIEKMYKEVGETLIDLDVEGKKYNVLVHETQVDPITLELIHVDFYQPNLKETTEADVHLDFTGIAPAVKLGGTMITNMREVTVEALPKDLPNKIEVDVSELKEIGDAITIDSIKVPQGVKVVFDDPEEVVVQIVEPEDVDKELAEPIEEIDKGEPEEKASEEDDNKE
ncbi:MAG: large subunit ribosomal protein [Patescibacteria group bacterium]|nr:large subunit ribosomal protein [Patescibacteria group bacterium]